MNKDYPLVSIVTPTYNQAEFLATTIESVLNQDYPNIEYIVINDGSTDKSEKILNEYTGRLFWETQKNIGQTATINKGWKKSKGDILAYLNSDDTYYENNAVSIAVDFFRNNMNAGIVYGGSAYIDAAGNKIGTYNAYPFDYEKVFCECQNPIPQPSAFIRREVIDKVGFLDENLYYSMDWDLWLRAGLHYRIEFIPHLLSTYRLHAKSKSLSALSKAARDTIYIYTKLLSSPELPEHIKEKQKGISGLAYLKSAEQAFAGGDITAARKFFIKALRLNAKCFEMRHYAKCLLSLISPVGDRLIKNHYTKLQNYMD